MSENAVLGFQFEPKRINSNNEEFPYEQSDTQLSYKTEDRTSMDVLDWCKCEACITMRTHKECQCCSELNANELSELGDKKCITEHDHFYYIVLMKGNLWTALVGMHDRENSGLPPKENVPARTYRYAAYRQFTWWVHNRLGRSVRRVIPACVTKRIREEFPSPDGTYTGFKEGQKVDEIDFTWIHDVGMADDEE